MNIDSNYRSVTPNYQNRSNSTNFTALHRGTYEFLSHKTPLRIYELEKGDLGFLEYFSKNLQKFFKKNKIEDDSRKQVIEEAVNASKEILKSDKEDKAKIFMAVSDKTPCGFFIGNVRKVGKDGKVCYSSRKNHSPNETEADWVVTWKSGTGKPLGTEFFRSVLRDTKFKSAYVRSEVPENSGAVEYYGKLGFKEIDNKYRKILGPHDNSYEIGQYDDVEDYIVPMKVTRKGMADAIKRMEKSAKYTEGTMYSTELDKNALT